MKNKGFTLIELLAVIVILAIIALIATPIILNIIGDTKDSSVVRSGELYLSAVESAIARENLKGKFDPTECTIESDGNLTCGGTTLKIETTGSRPTTGTITIVNGKISKVENMSLDGYKLTQENGKLVAELSIGDNNKVELNPKGTYLMTTPSVNSADTTFLGGNINRSTIETITITNTKTVPSNAIASWDVSEKKDKSVMAWYTDTDNNNLYELYIGGDGGVKANPNSSYLFDYFNNVTTIDVKYLDTSNVENMICMFSISDDETIGKLKNIIGLNNFNTSKVTNMCGMFSECRRLTNLDLSSFDTSNVTNMSGMFQECFSLASLNLSSFDTSKVTDMSSMFFNCGGLTTIDVSKFNTSNVVNMHYMFYNCYSLNTLGVSNFNTSNVTDMSEMFSSCSGLTNLDLSNFDTSNVTNMSSMFSDCTNLTTIDLRNSLFTSVTNNDNVFHYANKLTTVYVKDEATKTFIDNLKSGVAVIAS